MGTKHDVHFSSQYLLYFTSCMLEIAEYFVLLHSQTHAEPPCIRSERLEEGALHFELRR